MVAIKHNYSNESSKLKQIILNKINQCQHEGNNFLSLILDGILCYNQYEY